MKILREKIGLVPTESYGTAWIRNSGIKQEYPTYNTRFHRLLLSNSFVEYKNEDNALFFIAVVS